MESINTVLNEIGENFLSCPICIQHLKEPKVLPCLHRYCSDCLESFIKQQQQQQGELQCAVCREFFTIPSEGFKTDYFIKSLVEHVTLEKPEIDIDLHNCVRCHKHRTAVAYCFDRKGYLCENCYYPHVKVRNSPGSCSSYAGLKEIIQEVQMKSECFTFSYASAINKVDILAVEERKRLAKKSRALKLCEKYIVKMPGKKTVLERVDVMVMIYRETVLKELKCQERLIEDDVKIFNQNLFRIGRIIQKIEGNLKNVILWTVWHMVNWNQVDVLNELQEVRWVGERNKQFLMEMIIELQIKYEVYSTCLRERHSSTKNEVNKLAKISTRLRARYDKLTKLSSNILESWNNWMAVKHIPDVCASIDHLEEDIKDTFIKLEFGVLCNIETREKVPFYTSSDRHKLISNMCDKYEVQRERNRTVICGILWICFMIFVYCVYSKYLSVKFV
ncbi:E3 ubiquitin-protein ligase TRIM56-like isoform X1 [Apostichopus japonicus]|uniref:E3 ubiquitin-protein ligase TRIM56-like isoform X1 n=1 Tax=Stichopus japonicus TaxID=307972 RepID=UPI003AB53F0B